MPGRSQWRGCREHTKEQWAPLPSVPLQAVDKPSQGQRQHAEEQGVPLGFVLHLAYETLLLCKWTLAVWFEDDSWSHSVKEQYCLAVGWDTGRSGGSPCSDRGADMMSWAMGKDSQAWQCPQGPGTQAESKHPWPVGTAKAMRWWGCRGMAQVGRTTRCFPASGIWARLRMPPGLTRAGHSSPFSPQQTEPDIPLMCTQRKWVVLLN